MTLVAEEVKKLRIEYRYRLTIYFIGISGFFMLLGSYLVEREKLSPLQQKLAGFWICEAWILVVATWHLYVARRVAEKKFPQ